MDVFVLFCSASFRDERGKGISKDGIKDAIQLNTIIPIF